MATELDRRLELEAQVLFHLWAEGATPLHRLLEILKVPQPAARAAVSSLAGKRYIYKLFEPPGNESSSIYYLTSSARDRLEQLFQGDPRYYLKQLWYTLKREETKLPPVRPSA
jgi:DNA-binding MarR family transcriptional regulator